MFLEASAPDKRCNDLSQIVSCQNRGTMNDILPLGILVTLLLAFLRYLEKLAYNHFSFYSKVFPYLEHSALIISVYLIATKAHLVWTGGAIIFLIIICYFRLYKKIGLQPPKRRT